jgi:hypothetical protein
MMQYPGALTSKLPTVGTTIFTTMSRMAAEHNAVNLSQGFPDFPVSNDLKKPLLKKHLIYTRHNTTLSMKLLLQQALHKPYTPPFRPLLRKVMK